MDVDAILERGLDCTGRVVAGVRPEQYGNSTPCAEWTVRDLLNHVIGGNHFFAAAAAGNTPDIGGETPDLIGDDPATAYAQSAKTALEAWRRPGVAESTIKLPFGEMPGSFAMGIHFVDHLVHSWDLAKATGQDTAVDAELAEAAYGIIRGNVPEQFRGPGGPFGPEVSVPEDAPIQERLVAYLGRQP